MRVIFTPLAERHINNLYDYIAERASEARAEAYISRIISHREQLAMFPERGTKRDEILAGLRTFGFERRVTIAFMIMPNAVLIEGIFYGGQDFEAAFRR